MKFNLYIFLSVFFFSSLFSQAFSVDTKPKSEAPQQNFQRYLKRIWWNNTKKFGTINLTIDQRKKFDVLLVSFLKSNLENKKQQKEQRNAMGAFLLEGNKEKILANRKSLADLFQKSVIEQLTMVEMVVQGLTPEQKLLINEKYPKLFSSFWIPGAISGSIKERKPRVRKVKVTQKEKLKTKD